MERELLLGKLGDEWLTEPVKVGQEGIIVLNTARLY